MLRKIGSLAGRSVHATDGELGKVDEFIFDDKTWAIRYMVVETGNWLSGRKVLISPSALKTPDRGSKIFSVALTYEQVRTSPDIDTHKTVSRRHELALQKHYAWPACAGNGTFPAAWEEVRKPKSQASSKQAREDVNLRSTRAVTGYSLHAADGLIGHVRDYIIDDRRWLIRFLVADTGTWLPGRKVLIWPHWIKRVKSETSEVFVGLPREVIRNSPEFNQGRPVSEDYEKALYEYYERHSTDG